MMGQDTVVYAEAVAVSGNQPMASAPTSAPEYSSNGPVPAGINEGMAKEYLAGHKWPIGLQETSVEQMRKIAMRYFICDDSGSMMASDGHKLMTTATGVHRFVTCTRWQELTESLKFHAGLAHAANSPTEFRFLNGGPPIRVGIPDAGEAQRFQTLNQRLEDSPTGGTPLCRHIREVIQEISSMEGQLRASGQKACLVIATDGESGDGDIITAMQPLRNLPVWVVVRLCTDEDRIVEYWNNIDAQLEVEMDVLDDLSGEAAEVATNNNWLTYGEPMHRLREFGVLIKEMDVMDSDRLSPDQIRKFASVIFGGSVDSYPHPELDFAGFIAAVQRQNDRTSRVWCPVSQRPQHWIRMSRLRRLNPHSKCSIM